MHITPDLFPAANRAMASVLLLYYHLLREGGFTHDQTVYLDPAHFNALDHVDVTVDESGAGEIDALLLREGSVVCLLCDLDDMVAEHENDYLQWPLTQAILRANALGRLVAVPEAALVIAQVERGIAHLDMARYRALLQGIYEKYVVGRWQALGRLPG